MKNKFLTLMLVVCSSVLVNCSKNSSSDNTAVTTAGICSAGTVYTTQGCLPQSTQCGANYTAYGYLNGSCYPVTTSNTSTCGTAGYVQTSMGCLPQTARCGANYGDYNGTACYPVTSTGLVNSCLSTDVVNTQIGTLTVGVCQPYCAQYGKKYGYSNGYCYPAY